jgi:hypothetical protein
MRLANLVEAALLELFVKKILMKKVVLSNFYLNDTKSSITPLITHRRFFRISPLLCIVM